jgi:AbrB family looped-hinge helix DNA binding protein
MSYRVGPKGQVVIEKSIRDRLGVRPGSRAVQVLVGDHVEIRFLPADHEESLAGCLAVYAANRPAPSEAEIDAVVARAIAEDAAKAEP